MKILSILCILGLVFIAPLGYRQCVGILALEFIWTIFLIGLTTFLVMCALHAFNKIK